MTLSRTTRHTIVAALVSSVAGVVLWFAWPFLYVFWMIASDMPDCSASSEAVRYARSLEPARLERLYADMDRWSLHPDLRPGGYDVYDPAVEAPPEFRDVKAARVRPAQGNIMLEGCLDHYVFLEFHGVGDRRRSKERGIELFWGPMEKQGREFIWRPVERRAANSPEG